MVDTNEEDGNGVPSEVRKLIAQFIKSVGHLETLLYLYNHRSQSFTALEMSRELRTNEAYANIQLNELSQIIAKVSESSFQYRGDAETDKVVQELAKVSREKPHSIINFIYAAPKPAEAHDPLRSFADAFKLKKDP